LIARISIASIPGYAYNARTRILRYSDTLIGGTGVAHDDFVSDTGNARQRAGKK
jgi:hypothetical protein